jgi:hypothetical protein
MTALRAFRQDDLQLIAGWANAFDLEKYVSRLRPRDALAVCHDPKNGLFWFVIVSSGVDVGTIWLEPGDRTSADSKHTRGPESANEQGKKYVQPGEVVLLQRAWDQARYVIVPATSKSAKAGGSGSSRAARI